jgi:membrane dipeptidase
MNNVDDKFSCAVIDSHVDLLYDLIRRHPAIGLPDLPDAWVSIPKLHVGGVRVIVSAFYCPDANNGPDKAADYLRFLFDYSDKYLQGLATIRTVGELEACYHGKGAPGMLLLLENADALMEITPEKLKQRGFNVVGMTHVGRNRLGDGNAVENPEGLTPAGRDLVRELDRIGFAIDTAHLSEPAFREVSEQFSGPLISTHTGLRAFFDTPRNLSEEQVKTILSRGGVIGIAAAPEILSADRQVDINSVFRQIDWLAQRHGPDGVGIGSDFGGFDSVCDRFEDHTRFPGLAKMLAHAGYPNQAIEGIMGGNWFRFLSRLLTPSPGLY